MDKADARRSKTTVIVLILVVFALSACTFEVQPIEEYTSEDGNLSVSFPADWDVIQDDPSIGMTMLLLVENPLNLEPEEVPIESAGMFVMVMPIDMLGLEESELDPKVFIAIMGAAGLEDPLAAIEEITLPNGNTALRVWKSGLKGEGYLYTFDYDEDLIVVGAIMEYPGSAESAAAIAEEMLATMEFHGDVDAYLERASEWAVPGF